MVITKKLYYFEAFYSINQVVIFTNSDLTFIAGKHKVGTTLMTSVRNAVPLLFERLFFLYLIAKGNN